MEKLVEQRTVELKTANVNLSAVLNSLGQGFLTFDSTGQSGKVFTRACLDILEASPEGKVIGEILRVPKEKHDEFSMWLNALFQESLPFESLKPLGPTLFPHSQGKYVTVDYFPIRQESKIKEVVMVATDKTAEHQAQIELENERQHASMVLKYVKNKEQFLGFLQGVRKAIEKAQKTAETEMDSAAIGEGFRLLHTLEGESGTFSIQSLRQQSRECHKFSNHLRPKAHCQKMCVAHTRSR